MVGNLDRASLVISLFHEALMEITWWYSDGSWARSKGPIQLSYLPHALVGVVVRLDSPAFVHKSAYTWPFQHGSLRIGRLLTQQLRALRAGVSVSKANAALSFMT